jgi:glycosyltransferase involved in cell wall biosynthesis
MVDVVFVTHEAQRSGAPMILLNLLRWLRGTSDISFSVVVGGEGPLVDEFKELAPVSLAHENGAEQLNQARVLYANSTWSHPLLDRAPSFEAPVISHVHELTSLLRQVDPTQAGKRPRRYIAVSEQVRETLVSDYPIEPHEVSVCKAFVPVSEIVALSQADDPIDWADFGLPANARVVGAVGSLWPGKGPDLFVDMAANLIEEHRQTAADVHFVWIGGPVPLIPHIQRYVDEKDVGHRVHLLGEFRRPFQLMRSLDVFVVPSREDAFPLVVLEAGALGRSVVAFECGGGVRELLADGRGVLVEDEDVVSISRQVVALLDDESHRQRVGAALERYVGEKHDVARRAPDILRVIESELRQ